MASASRPTITGIRSWIGSSSSLASVVMIVHVRIAFSSGEVQVSHRPANASGSPLVSPIVAERNASFCP